MTRGSARAARADESEVGARSGFAAQGPWPLASVLGVLVLCLCDLIAQPPVPRPPELGLLAGLAISFGIAHGGLWSLAFALLRKLPRPLRLAFWPLAGLAAGLWLAYLLGVFPRLQSRYWKMAANVLAVSTVAGTCFGGLVALFQPRADERAWLPARRAWLRAIAILALLAVAAGAWYADRVFYPGHYRYGHVALRLLSLWSLMLALAAASPRRLSVGGWIWGAAFGAAAASLFAPNPQRLLPPLAAKPWPGMVLKITQNVTDFDGDGYSALLGGGDCAPWNARVHPGAREVPDNGIDENCLLGDATRRRDDRSIPAMPTTPPPVDVVLITVDSLRPDHLGLYDPAYGPNGRGTSPNLDRFAQRATIFDHAYTTGAWTSVAVPSLLRGVYPRRLQWKRWFETTRFALVRKPLAGKLERDERLIRMFPLAFDDPHPPIASLMRQRGLYTAAIVDDGHSEMLQPGTGLDAGFVSFREVDNAPADRQNDAGTVDMAIATLGRIPPNRRFFMWVHFFGPHWPDDAHPGVRVYGSSQADAYDHEVAFFDEQCARLLHALEARPHPVAVILTADHGESLAGGIRQHGLTLDEAVIQVPLLVRAPGWPARHISAPVSTLDIVPTILGLTNTPAPAYLDGIDLRRLVDGALDKPRVLFTDTWRYDAHERLEINYSAAFDGTYKVILDRMTGSVYEFDQRGDDRPLVDSTDPALERLTWSLFGYLEEAGGALDLPD